MFYFSFAFVLLHSLLKRLLLHSFVRAFSGILCRFCSAGELILYVSLQPHFFAVGKFYSLRICAYEYTRLYVAD